MKHQPNYRKTLKQKTLGETLRSRRKQRKIKLETAAHITKIRVDYLEALETGNYDLFASEVYLKGFLKNYGKYLGLDKDLLLAMYRREQTSDNDRKVEVNKNRSVFDRFHIAVSPKRFLSIGVILLLASVFTVYTVNQLSTLFTPPEIEITSPVPLSAGFDGEIYVAGNSFRIEGTTDPQTVITINSEVVELAPGNLFATSEIPLKEAEAIVIISATNNFGQSSSVKLKVKKGSTGVAEEDKMNILVEVVDDVTPILVRADGIIQFNDRAFPGDIIQLEASQILQIESESPFNLLVTINGEVYEFTKRDKVWRLVDGTVVESE